ncbi:ComEA family DNA-binding protein [Pseudarthrobacter sp. NamE2]|uniref:ComEA family DNA-binding protein n=1 Tax=Pseudarthrobacter sp. NamE2 TaxID=2576838 RepID=UPI0010FDC1A1|nr:ComEA family DNA-binding protein [Pseudarthrobacter sp. NamE2]TLM86383.1 ComEA family DNA-binding protein [Pseudarthrobacter sp. NamE2]
MWRRDAEADGPARHARARLQATLGGGPRGLLMQDTAGQEFEYRNPGDAASDSPCPDSRPGEDAETAGVGPVLRWRLGLRAAILLGVLAVAAGAFFWWQTASNRPQVLPLAGAASTEEALPGGSAGEGAGTAADADAPGTADPAAAGAGTVVVHVAGAVTSPGIVQLPAGSRVHEAINHAGGAAPDADLNRLNLALVLEDAQKIHVPRQGGDAPPAPDQPGIPGPASGGADAPAGSKVNLNTAGVAELDALPKVGPVLAQRIVDWREDHGAFKSVDELDAVDGVGPKMLEQLLPLVTV